MQARVITALVVATAVVATSWALFTSRFFPLHDYVHVARIVQMSRSLEEGQFPVRWSELFGYGYGMPLFEFYAPLPFYLGSLLYLFNVPALVVLRLLFIVCSALTALGGYVLGQRLFKSTQAASLTALAIALAPYRSVNLFIRGAVGEAWGIMAIPWVLWAIAGMWQSKKHSFIWLVATLVVLFLSHNLVTFIAAPFILAWFLGFGWRTTRDLGAWRSVTLRTIAAGALAVGAAAFYLVPAYLEKNFTQVSQLITNGYFDYHLHFLYLRQFVNPAWGYGGSEWGAQDKISFFLGWGQVVGLVAAMSMSAWALVSQQPRQLRPLAINLLSVGVLGGLALLMTTFKLQFIWDALPLFTFVQFPWRYLSLALVLVGICTGGSVLLVPKPYRKLAFAVLVVLVLLNSYYFRPEKYLDTPEGLYYSDPQRITIEMSGILPDYIPSTAPASRSAQPNLGVALLCQVNDNCQNQEQTLGLLGHQKLVNATATQPYQMVFATNSFPGWRAEIDGQPAPVVSTPDGLVAVDLPSGSHQVSISFGSTPVRAASDTISLASIFILAVLALMGLL